MSPTKLIQVEENSCGLICIAMITDLPYDFIKEKFSESFCNRCGLGDDDVTFMLNEHGFATAWKWHWYSPMRHERQEWPADPFAPIHLVKVRVQEGNRLCHYVVMLNDGTVWDPNVEQPVLLSAYSKVLGICGVQKIVTDL